MATKHPTSHLTFLGDPHSGRDEMNLAGHPFALLQSPKRQSETSIFYEWKRTISGREVTASWRVETPAAFGLPGPEEELLYLVLLQLTREAAEVQNTPHDWPLTVKFSRGDLLRRLGWHSNAHRYAALETAFSRLKAVSIFAKYAFYDARAKAPIDSVGFGILDSFSLVAEPRGRKSQGNIPLSHFEWNTVLHTSFLAGNVRSLALDFAISLQHPSSRRLFRLLDVLAQPRKTGLQKFSIGLWKMRDRLGMASYRHPSKVCEKLAPAVAELTERGYLDGLMVEKDATGAPMAIFRFQRLPVSGISSEAPPDPLRAPQTASPQLALELPRFAVLLPDLDAPARVNSDDPDAARLDAIFEGLPPAEKDAIDARVMASLPRMLQQNPRAPGAMLGLRRGRRREVLNR